MCPELGSEVDFDKKKVHLSAMQLAEFADVHVNDIHYWGRAGYLNREENGRSPYPLNELNKVKLLALLSKRLGIKPAKASALADQLLNVYSDQANSLEATTTLINTLSTRITEFVDLIVELGLVPRLKEILYEGEDKEK